MSEVTYVVEIAEFDERRLVDSRTGSGYCRCTVWYRSAFDGNKYTTVSMFIGGYKDPNKLLNDILNYTTDHVRSAWFIVKAGSAMRAVRMTTAEAVAQRLKG